MCPISHVHRLFLYDNFVKFSTEIKILFMDKMVQ